MKLKDVLKEAQQQYDGEVQKFELSKMLDTSLKFCNSQYQQAKSRKDEFTANYYKGSIDMLNHLMKTVNAPKTVVR